MINASECRCIKLFYSQLTFRSEKLERFARDKHTSLLGPFVSYEIKKMECCKYCHTDHIHNTSFYLKLTNGPNKLDCYITQDQKRLTVTNTLAYLAHFSA